MSFLQRLLGTGRDPRETMRPLWHRVVEISREPHWYAEEGVADSVAGRFDMITLVLALVMLRLDGNPDTAAPSALLTELFVDDMDGQLRQSGLGDVVVGKHVGKLVSVLGGRIGALRRAFDAENGDAENSDAKNGDAASGTGTELLAALERNVTLNDGRTPAELAPAIRRLRERLNAASVKDILAGSVA